MYKIEIDIPEENNALAQEAAEKVRAALPGRTVRVMRQMQSKPTSPLLARTGGRDRACE